jgi:phenylalanyl-tRNA synthetase beta chain
VDPDFTLPGLEAATRMILDLCGGEASEVVEDGAVIDTDRGAYRLDTDRVQSLVGMEIPADEQVRTLTALGFRLTATWPIRPAGAPTCRAKPIWWKRSRASPR